VYCRAPGGSERKTQRERYTAWRGGPGRCLQE